MLSAVLDDLARAPGVRVVTMLAAGHGSVPNAFRPVAPPDEEGVFRELAARADGTLVIAPEFDDLLYHRCRWAEQAGGRLLGPGPEAVRLAGDKLALAAYLRALGVPAPPTLPLGDALSGAGRVAFPAVCKPRHGAGSQSTSLVWDRDGLRRVGDGGPAAGFIVQPFVPGTAASVAFLLGPGRCLALPAASQCLSGGCFRYRGGRAPLPPALAGRARRLARAAVEALPGLRGYVGVDVVLGEEPDGSGDRVIEVNPRLTTSYVGLRALARGNLAEAMLCLARGTDPPELRWDEGPVAWTADGTVSWSGEPGA
jgi:predicted ATP-grasp superfamily ATP-dependent carboligase